MTVHYALDDPANFVLDIEAERRSWKQDMVVNVVGLVVIAAAAGVGAVTLCQGPRAISPRRTLALGTRTAGVPAYGRGPGICPKAPHPKLRVDGGRGGRRPRPGREGDFVRAVRPRGPVTYGPCHRADSPWGEPGEPT
ncbi:hypothetical protein GCM10010331_17260 [Streptomyces xanthochromogenes]|nr:hypothetical protein GCM10010331_17260 [Streptomyces xanthochromogenes]